MTNAVKINELKAWALRHGYKQSTHGKNGKGTFTKYLRSFDCEDGKTRDVVMRIVFKDKVLRIERNYFETTTSYNGELTVNNRWAKVVGGYYKNISINEENDKLAGLTRGL